MFSGFSFLFHRKGSLASQKRRNILGKRVTEEGGDLLEEAIMPQGATDDVFFVVGEELMEELRNGKIDPPTGDVSRIRSVEWIVESLKERNRVSDEPFKVFAPDSEGRHKRERVEGESEREARTPDVSKKRRYSSSSPLDCCKNTEEQQDKTPSQESIRIGDLEEAEVVQPGFSVNLELSGLFDEMGEALKRKKGADEFRARNYLKTAKALRELSFPLNQSSFHRLEQEKLGFGASTRAKIKEFLEKGTIGKAEAVLNDSKLKSVNELSTIWGVGPAQALKIYEKGFSSVVDLKNKSEAFLREEVKLSRAQLIGLRHWEDFSEKMRREEVEEFREQVERGCEKIGAGDIQCVVGGSYRRGREWCGDVDFVMFFKNEENYAKSLHFLDTLVEEMRKKGIFRETLSTFSFEKFDKTEIRRGRQKQIASWMGVGNLGAGRKYRRIDIKVYPRSLFPFALLHFTGSGPFNRKMRLHAKKIGFHLSEKGLFRKGRGMAGGGVKEEGKGVVKEEEGHVIDVSDGSEEEQGGGWRPVVCRTERDIFEALGLDYKEPEDRGDSEDLRMRKGWRNDQ